MIGIANMTIMLECHIKSRLKQNLHKLTTKEVAMIKLQVEMAINSMPSIPTTNPNTLTGIRVYIKEE